MVSEVVVQEITQGLWYLPFELGQAYLWQSPEGLVLVDTSVAGSGPAIRDAVQAIGHSMDDLRAVVITHYHDDHRGALSEVLGMCGAASVAHRVEAPVIRGEQAQPPPNLTEEERPLAEAVIPRVPQAPPAPISRVVEDGEKLFGSTVVHAPGHTPGSIALHIPALRALITGDTIASVNGRPILGPFNVDRQQAIAALKRESTLDVDIACFGHGAPLVGDAGAQLRRLAAQL